MYIKIWSIPGKSASVTFFGDVFLSRFERFPQGDLLHRSSGDENLVRSNPPLRNASPTPSWILLVRPKKNKPSESPTNTPNTTNQTYKINPELILVNGVSQKKMALQMGFHWAFFFTPIFWSSGPLLRTGFLGPLCPVLQPSFLTTLPETDSKSPWKSAF